MAGRVFTEAQTLPIYDERHPEGFGSSRRGEGETARGIDTGLPQRRHLIFQARQALIIVIGYPVGYTDEKRYQRGCPMARTELPTLPQL